jgi:predicted RNase H-like HicB family nuclease
MRKRASQTLLNKSGGKMSLTAVFQKVPEGYIGFVEELPGANTQGATLEEARQNLVEAVQLVLAANREIAEQEIADKTVIREKFDVPFS